MALLFRRDSWHDRVTAFSHTLTREDVFVTTRQSGWNTQDQHSVRSAYILPDGWRADYVLGDRHDRSRAVIEARRFSGRGHSH